MAKHSLYISSCLLFAFFVHSAQGATVFSDFDPTNVTYQGGWGIYGIDNTLSPGAYNSFAMAFTPSFNAILTDIAVAVAIESGTNSIVIMLDADNNGTPGAAITSWVISNLPPIGFCSNGGNSTGK